MESNKKIFLRKNLANFFHTGTTKFHYRSNEITKSISSEVITEWKKWHQFHKKKATPENTFMQENTKARNDCLKEPVWQTNVPYKAWRRMPITARRLKTRLSIGNQLTLLCTRLQILLVKEESRRLHRFCSLEHLLLKSFFSKHAQYVRKEQITQTISVGDFILLFPKHIGFLVRQIT